MFLCCFHLGFYLDLLFPPFFVSYNSFFFDVLPTNFNKTFIKKQGTKWFGCHPFNVLFPVWVHMILNTSTLSVELDSSLVWRAIYHWKKLRSTNAYSTMGYIEYICLFVTVASAFIQHDTSITTILIVPNTSFLNDLLFMVAYFRFSSLCLFLINFLTVFIRNSVLTDSFPTRRIDIRLNRQLPLDTVSLKLPQWTSVHSAQIPILEKYHTHQHAL